MFKTIIMIPFATGIIYIYIYHFVIYIYISFLDTIAAIAIHHSNISTSCPLPITTSWVNPKHPIELVTSETML